MFYFSSLTFDLLPFPPLVFDLLDFLQCFRIDEGKWVLIWVVMIFFQEKVSKFVHAQMYFFSV